MHWRLRECAQASSPSVEKSFIALASLAAAAAADERRSGARLAKLPESYSESSAARQSGGAEFTSSIAPPLFLSPPRSSSSAFHSRGAMSRESRRPVLAWLAAGWPDSLAAHWHAVRVLGAGVRAPRGLADSNQRGRSPPAGVPFEPASCCALEEASELEKKRRAHKCEFPSGELLRGAVVRRLARAERRRRQPRRPRLIRRSDFVARNSNSFSARARQCQVRASAA